MRTIPTVLCGALLALLPAAESAAAPPAEVLQALVDGRRPLADVTVRFASGRASHRGRTTLEVAGDGRLALALDSGGQVERFTATLSEAGVRTLVRLLLDTEPWTLAPQTGALPSDAEELSIRISTTAGDLDVEARFPITAAFDSPDLLSLVDAYRELARAARGVT